MADGRALSPITIVLSLLGIALAVVAGVVVVRRLTGETTTRTVSTVESTHDVRTTLKKENVESRPITVETPVVKTHEETVRITPGDRETIWLYAMLALGGFLGLFSLLTAAAWFYFLLRKDGSPPQVLTEMLKYLVSSFMGGFVGFMGGSSLPESKSTSSTPSPTPPPASTPK